MSLTLKRKLGQQVRITVPPSANERVVYVTPTDVKGNVVRGNSVRLCVQADRDIVVDREEVAREKDERRNTA